jgi:hypothetical protein
MYRRRGAGGVTIDFRFSQMKRHAVGPIAVMAQERLQADLR